ncbi:MAG TPA: hypothetical protein PKX11_04670 [Methanospirillum sp.]|uniref:hypothetical protein n=1 Tax=Methanospirillum sp. TaxID=45200 RepID=UPI0026047F31|nr:hypothetical protein [Methanospirillum sp.]HQB99828.1 hypothetical protein [Methanospirillum sp.]
MIRRSKDDLSPGKMYQVLKSQVHRVRKENEPPTRDPESFSRYVCDLCHSSGPLSGLRQCVICGRWGCSSCWHDDYYLCRSCSGIMNLLLIDVPANNSPPNPEKNDDSEDFLTENLT